MYRLFVLVNCLICLGAVASSSGALFASSAPAHNNTLPPITELTTTGHLVHLPVLTNGATQSTTPSTIESSTDNDEPSSDNESGADEPSTDNESGADEPSTDNESGADEPSTDNELSTDFDSLDVNDRASSKLFFETYYNQFANESIGWTGDHAGCDSGTTSQAYRDALQNLVNYFRAMAGVSAEIVFTPEFNTKAQSAALMMSVNRAISHYPDTEWDCYTPAGAEAARQSNLSYWYGQGDRYHGILSQMEDNGASNGAVGHRRWILYPQSRFMGTGDMPANSTSFATNVLWVIDPSTLGDPRPSTRDEFVAWPPPGYVPSPLIYNRWSFSYPSADFSAATVTMLVNDQTVNVTTEPVKNGYGENTLVWTPNETLPNDGDTTFNIQINKVQIDGAMTNFEYQVIGFAP